MPFPVLESRVCVCVFVGKDVSAYLSSSSPAASSFCSGFPSIVFFFPVAAVVVVVVPVHVVCVIFAARPYCCG